tara:strand:+ start:42652 stop:43104 length:453 start_codon:yes stop_codon:yes gene_type:complete
MRHAQPLIALGSIVALVALMFTTPACLGPSQDAVDTVVQEAQWPAAELAWPGVRGDFEAGVNDGVSEGDLMPNAGDGLKATADTLAEAIEAEDPAALRAVPWSLVMKPWAERGVNVKLGDGVIGPTVAQELLERVDNFTAVIDSLQGTDL